MESSPIDAVDREILYQLQQNARKPITEIADAANVSDNTVRNRIESLEEDGVIEGYQVNVNYDRAGVQHHYLFVCSARVSKRDDLAREAGQHNGVVEIVTLMTGKYNVYIYATSTEKDGITDIASDLDELGLEIEREHLIKSQDRRHFEGFHLPANL